jgi:hypothetical protein
MVPDFFNHASHTNPAPGVAYGNIRDTNMLTNAQQCEIDAGLMKTLGVNVIHVYTVDPTLNHTDCMKIFEDAGIYLILDLQRPGITLVQVCAFLSSLLIWYELV